MLVLLYNVCWWYCIVRVERIIIDAVSYKQGGVCVFCDNVHKFLVPIIGSDETLCYLFLCGDHFSEYMSDVNFLNRYLKGGL